MKVNVKGVTKGRNKIDTMIVPEDASIRTVRDLLVYMVSYCVREYNERQENRELLRVMSSEKIEDKVITGKIDFGKIYSDKKPDNEEAVANAIQSFEDGVIVLFMDGKKMERLEEKITVGADTELTFVKLTMLAGRMW